MQTPSSTNILIGPKVLAVFTSARKITRSRSLSLWKFLPVWCANMAKTKFVKAQTLKELPEQGMLFLFYLVVIPPELWRIWAEKCPFIQRMQNLSMWSDTQIRIVGPMQKTAVERDKSFCVGYGGLKQELFFIGVFFKKKYATEQKHFFGPTASLEIHTTSGFKERNKHGERLNGTYSSSPGTSDRFGKTPSREQWWISKTVGCGWRCKESLPRLLRGQWFVIFCDSL